MGVRELAASLLGVEQRSWGSSSPVGMFGGRGILRSEAQGGSSYDSAQTHSAVYACVDLLVRIVAWQMPPEVFRAGASGLGRDAVASLPTIITNPHPDPHLSSEHWRGQALESAALRGYVAGQVTSLERSGYPRQIAPFHPDELTVTRRAGRTDWRVNGKPAELWQLGGDLWVAPSPRVTPGGVVGKSVLSHAARAIGLGLEAAEFGRNYFAAGGMPVAHLKVDVPEMSDDEADVVKQKYLTATAGRSPLVTVAGVELDRVEITAEESQFLATIAANVADVCRFFGIPPEAIGASSGDSMTYANVEGRNLSLLTNTAGAWMQWFRRILTDLLPRPQIVELDPEALLRTSVPTLFATAEVGLKSGILTRNETRAMVGYGPVDGGDESAPLVPATTNGGAQNA